MGPLKSSILLGFIWTFWHLPDFLTSSQGGGPDADIQVLIINLISFTILVPVVPIMMTWLFNRTDGSISKSLLALTSINTPQITIMSLFKDMDLTKLNLVCMGVFLIIAVFLIIFTKAQLGFKKQEIVGE